MKESRFHWYEYGLFAAVAVMVLLLCVCVGSVSIPLSETARVIVRAVLGQEQAAGTASAIVLKVRLPRVLCVALVGASLSLCGAAMQGLLRNPLADGSTLGVSSGASLGAVVAIMLGFTLPGPLSGTMLLGMVFAFLSMVMLLSMAFALDRTLATGTIILIGVIFSMFVSALLSLLITFAGEKLRTVTFWTMGSMASASYGSALTLLGALIVAGGVLMLSARELNAFALGEEQALHLGVNVRRVKLTVMIAVCALIGVCVAIGGSIGFVGLVTPHMARMIVGPNHRRLLPTSLFGGAVFLMLSDLLARTLLSPVELPVGVVTSLIGAVVFVVIFFRSRKEARA